MMSYLHRFQITCPSPIQHLIFGLSRICLENQSTEVIDRPDEIPMVGFGGCGKVESANCAIHLDSNVSMVCKESPHIAPPDIFPFFCRCEYLLWGILNDLTEHFHVFLIKGASK